MVKPANSYSFLHSILFISALFFIISCFLVTLGFVCSSLLYKFLELHCLKSFYIFKIEVYFIYNIILVSDGQHSHTVFLKIILH